MLEVSPSLVIGLTLPSCGFPLPSCAMSMCFPHPSHVSRLKRILQEQLRVYLLPAVDDDSFEIIVGVSQKSAVTTAATRQLAPAAVAIKTCCFALTLS